MCLLVNQKAETLLSVAFLQSVFDHNHDGLGVMYATDGVLHIQKSVPKTEDEFLKFYNEHIMGRDCIWHARMQTHGDINLDNCHPYEVIQGVWMAHNGVLNTGNANDTSRSDTWHFIYNYLRPALSHDLELLFDPDFQAFLGTMIGSSNKFGFMCADGRSVIINERAGVMYQGAWLSNTYAWDYYKLTGTAKPTYSKSSYDPTAYYKSAPLTNWGKAAGSGYNASTGGYVDQDDADEWDWYNGDRIATREEVTEAQLKPMLRALCNSYERKGEAGVAQWVKDAPTKAAKVLMFYYEDCVGIEGLVDEDPEEAVLWLVDLLVNDSIAPRYYS